MAVGRASGGRRWPGCGPALGGPLELDGLETNRDLLAAVLDEADFAAGADGHRLPRPPPRAWWPPRCRREVRRRHAAAAALFLEHAPGRRLGGAGRPPELAQRGPGPASGPLAEGDDRIAVSVGRALGGLEVMVEGPGDLAAPLDPELVAEVTLTRGARST